VVNLLTTQNGCQSLMGLRSWELLGNGSLTSLGSSERVKGDHQPIYME
jgi:hypothetical protein